MTLNMSPVAPPLKKTPKKTIPKPPGVTSIVKPVPVVTPKTSSIDKTKLSAYGTTDSSGAFSVTTVPMLSNGQVINMTIPDAIAMVGDPTQFKVIGDTLRANGQIGQTTNDLKTIKTKWAYFLNASAKLKLNPFDYINSLGSTLPTKQSPTTTYITDYSGSKGQSAFQAAFSNVFGRLPNASDNSSYWINLLNKEAQKPGNQEVVSRNKDGSQVVSKGGLDAQAWLTAQLTEQYRKGIQAGTINPDQGIETQYSNLASDYGIDIYDPNTKGLNTSALLDLSALATKTKTLDQIKEGWANSVVAKYGNLTPQIKQAGLTLRQVADPAVSTMSQILGIDKNSIPLNDKLIQQYLTGDGKTVMPTYQYEQLLRQDPRWKSSKDAQDNLSNVAVTLAKEFGVMG